jgi:hypothetical protein
MVRSSLLALCLVLAACTSAVVPPQTSPPASRAPRTFAPTPFNEGTIHYADTVRAFVDAYDAGRYDDALAYIDERFMFSGDCDYGNRRIYSLSDREAMTYWLRAGIADHDRIDIVRLIDLGNGEATIGVEMARSSDTLRRSYGGSIRPRVPMVIRFSPDGRRIMQLRYEWSMPVAPFADCLP